MATSRGLRLAVPLLALFAAPWPALAVVNTMQDASTLLFVACNGRVGFRTSERNQANTDLNGDGDRDDYVLQIVDVATSVVTNVGVDASGPLACSGDKFVFGVSEFSQANLDRNGDGDAFDIVLAVYDAGTATLTNVGLAVAAIVASPDLVAFTVNESSQGGTILNGDGDVLDHVLHVLDPTTLAVTDVGVEAGAEGSIRVTGRRVAFVLSEDAQGHTDFNGDGDPVDQVVLFYDAATSTLINPHRAIVPELGIVLDDTAAAFVVSEAAHGGVSQNTDADAFDAVLHLFCFGGPPCTTSGLVNVGVDAGGGFRLDGDLLAFRTREASEPGGSLNPPDVDTRDRVIQYYRLSTGTVTNTGLAGHNGMRIIGDQIAIAVSERTNGQADRNGDGDHRDIVLALYDTLTATVTNTGQAIWPAGCKREPIPVPQPRGSCLASGQDMVLFPVQERGQGHTDLNGDGDYRDPVFHAWRVSTSTLINGGVAMEPKTTIAAGATLGTFRVSEPRQGGQILNGDGDSVDNVIAVYDDLTGTVTQLGQAADPLIVLAGPGDRTVVFRTSEAAQNVDLNGDGDKTDAVLQFQAF